MDLVDHDDGIVVVGLQDVAVLDEQVARAAIDRRADRRVAELEPSVVDVGLRGLERRAGVLDRRLVGLDRRFHGRHVRVELVVLLARDQLLGHQLAIAPLLHPRVRELGGVALDGGLRLANLGLALVQRRLGLAQRGLEGTGIDDEEQIALLDVLSFLETHLDELSVDLRLDAHRGVGLRVTDGRELDRDGLLDDVPQSDGHRR